MHINAVAYNVKFRKVCATTWFAHWISEDGQRVGAINYPGNDPDNRYAVSMDGKHVDAFPTLEEAKGAIIGEIYLRFTRKSAAAS